MSFENFLAAIDEPGLRTVALHWNAARGTRRMPAWRDIDPIAIAHQLPIVWSWKYDREHDSFTGRLAGEEIYAAFGKSLRGVDMKSFFAGMDYELIFARHKRVVTEPAFALGRGPVFIHARRHGLGQRIIMPLASDGRLADGILGATVYHFAGEPAAGQAWPAAESVDYFPLD